MRHTVYLLIVSLLSALPLECMHKICPHQNQNPTLFTIRKQVVENPHLLACFLDDNLDVRDIAARHPDFFDATDVDAYCHHLKVIRTMVRNVLSHLKPSDIPLEHCELCYRQDREYAVRPYLTQDFNGIIREESNRGAIIEKFSTIFEDYNITQQLMILYHLQQKIRVPNLSVWGPISLLLITAIASRILEIAFKGAHTFFKDSSLMIMIPITLLSGLLLSYFFWGKYFGVNFALSKPIYVWHFFTDKKRALKQKIIAHFVNEIRYSIRPNYQDDSFKKIMRSKLCDLNFRFN